MEANLDLPNVNYGTYACNIRIDGLPMSPDFQVIMAEVNHGFQYIGSLKIVLKTTSALSGGISAGLSALPLSGAAIQLDAVFGADTLGLFSGVVVSHEFKNSAEATRLVIHAKNKAVGLSLTRKPEVFADRKDPEMIEELAGRAGCTFTELNTTGLPGLKHNQIVKNGITDWDFINIRAEANGIYIRTEGAGIILERPSVGQDPLKTIHAGYGRNILELHQKQDDRQYRLLDEWISWDLSDLQAGIATDDDQTDAGTGRPVSGKAARVNYRQNNEQEVDITLNAAAQLRTLSKLNGTVSIRPELTAKPGDTVEISGYNEAVNGKYLVSAVMHEYGQGGFKTHLQFGLNHCSFSRRFKVFDSCRRPVVYAGIVSGLEGDPENLNRIRIRIPTFSEGELWARVAQPYAGPGYGWFVLPEPGDEVLVSFLGEDMDYPVVTGSLYSPKNMPPAQAGDDNHEKLFQTRSGMKLYWNDEKKIHEISTPGGNLISLSEDSKSLTISDQNGNKMEMTDAGVSVSALKDIAIKAGSGIKIEGQTLTLKGSGIVKINGSTVKIN